MKIRFATEADCGLILDFIRRLAEYEKMAEQVIATEELLREWIFAKKRQRFCLPAKGIKKLDLLCFSITFPRSSGARVSIWRICSFFRNTEKKAMGRLF